MNRDNREYKLLKNFEKLCKQAEIETLRQQEVWTQLNKEIPPGPGMAKRRHKRLLEIDLVSKAKNDVIVGPWK